MESNLTELIYKTRAILQEIVTCYSILEAGNS